MRKRMMRRVRKNIMKLGTIVREEAITRDDDGTLIPKSQRGYSVEAVVNGWDICSVDDCWYQAYKGCLEGAKYAMEETPGKHTPDEFKKKEE